MKRYLALATVAAAALTSPAQATVTIYTTQAAYLAAISTPGVDTYNNITPGVQLAASLTRPAGTYGYTVTDVAIAGGTAALFGAGSTADAWLSNNENASTISYSAFTGGVRGAGANFFGTDVNGLFVAGGGNGLTLTATDASGTVTTTVVNPTTSTFIGFVSTTGLTGLTVRATTPNASYWATVNNLTLGGAAVTPAVPEPATWGMMILGFGMIGAASRSRKVKTTVKFA
jgi:hypothetical protein